MNPTSRDGGRPPDALPVGGFRGIPDFRPPRTAWQLPLGTRWLSRGFTLLEIMIVISMAALVMVISIPFVQRTVRHDAVYTAVKVIDDACRNARALAIFNNTTAELIIHPQEKSFSVRAGTPRASPPPKDNDAPRPAANHGLKPFSGRLADDVTIELLDVNFSEHRDADEATVRFQPNGTADEFTIFFRIGATAARKITLDIVTGLPALEVIR